MSKRKRTWTGILFAATLFAACQQNDNTKTITITNHLDMPRASETVSIPVAEVEALVEKFGAENILIRDAETDSVLMSQAFDNNADGTVDEILFQADIKANAEKTFTVTGAENAAAQRPKSDIRTYSRFVPERTDDYTWENDKVAFRTYGPVAQQMVEQGKAGGTLTSGIDAWLKRVPYPIINKWYEGYKQNSNFYHIDRGEGYDPYHVGKSRGIGGIGVLENDSLYVSKNFTGYKTIAEGPIRTVFELTYAPWQANGRTITETKRISLDLGSNLSYFEEDLQSDKPLPNYTIGISLHEKKGEVKASPEEGWFGYWEPMDSAMLGTGIVLAPAAVQDYKDHRVDNQDQSHLYVITKPKNGKVKYYAGFGWSKSGQFNSKEEWDQYLSDFAKRLASPLEVKFDD